MRLSSKVFSYLTALLVALVSVPALAQGFIEGQDYTVLQNPEAIKGDKIIVREFFWYGCPHCYKLEPYSQAYKKSHPADVAFYQTPAAMNPVWEASARGFYAVQFMNKLEATHLPLFEAIHKDNARPYNQSLLADFYAAYGVDKAKFNSLFNSFAVSTKVGRSKAAAQRYQLSGVPAVVVQGKYVVKGEDARVFQIVNHLVDKVRAEQAAN